MTPGGFYLSLSGSPGFVPGPALLLSTRSRAIEITLFAPYCQLSSSRVFRKPLVKRLKKATPQADVPEFIGETATAVEMIPAGARGNVELRRGQQSGKPGTREKDLAQKAMCTVLAREGLLFIVET